MSNIKSNCQRLFVRRAGKKTQRGRPNQGVYYTRPVEANDLKREGRFMRVVTDSAELHLDGPMINMIKNALRDAGEVNLRADWKQSVPEEDGDRVEIS